MEIFRWVAGNGGTRIPILDTGNLDCVSRPANGIAPFGIRIARIRPRRRIRRSCPSRSRRIRRSSVIPRNASPGCRVVVEVLDMNLSLVVLNAGKAAGQVVPVPVPEFVVGRDAECNLRPASILISKKHCAIVTRGEEAFVCDFGSTNGTFVNDKPVHGEAPSQERRQPQDRPAPVPRRDRDSRLAASDPHPTPDAGIRKGDRRSVPNACTAARRRCRRPPARDGFRRHRPRRRAERAGRQHRHGRPAAACSTRSLRSGSLTPPGGIPTKKPTRSRRQRSGRSRCTVREAQAEAMTAPISPPCAADWPHGSAAAPAIFPGDTIAIRTASGSAR